MKNYFKNPRKISKQQIEFLKKELLELGDLSGIIHDLNSDEIIGGNQRSKIFDINKCRITIVAENKKPDMQGTVAHGFVIWKGNKYSYRQVRWNKKQCERANLIANKAGGEFDIELLSKEFDLTTVLESGFTKIDLNIPELDFDEAPKSVKDNVEELKKIKEIRKKGNTDIMNKTDTEKYLVIVFPNRIEKEKLLTKMHLAKDERYIPSTSVEIMKVHNYFVKERAAKSNKSGSQG